MSERERERDKARQRYSYKSFNKYVLNTSDDDQDEIKASSYGMSKTVISYLKFIFIFYLYFF